MTTLLCPVRACGAPLAWEDRAARCPRGHSFDRARSGYVNLLQPQDRRARAPGDSRSAAQARRRSVDLGAAASLLEAIAAEAARLRLTPGAAVLDAGCGEGTLLARLAERLGLEAWGVDLSAAALELAARRHPGPRYIVANADRRLPFADGSFALVLSIESRKNGPEFRRLLSPGGRLLCAVAGPDDLAEVRALLFGRVLAKDRGARAAELLAGDFALEDTVDVRATLRLPRAAILDLLAGSYRAARHRERERLAALPDEMDVTTSARLLCFQPRP
jgi:23S rRNA (guanine745-N1)-methyltransferase